MENRLRVLRAERCISQEALAKLAGLSRVTVNRVERGTHIPDGRTMMKLAQALGRPVADLFPPLLA